MNLCKVCKGSLEHKRKGAQYCCSKCKFTANKNLDSIKAYSTSAQGRALAMWHNSKTRAKQMDLEHSLTVPWIQEKLEKGICEVTGLPVILAYGQGKQPWAPSLDRIDSNVGYTLENTRLVVWLYNSAKNVFDDSDVLLMATALLKHADGSMKSQTSKRERKR